MEIFGFPLLLEVALGLVVVVLLIYKYLTRNVDYWKNRGVVHVKPHLPFTKNSAQDKEGFRELPKFTYSKYRAERYVGLISSTGPQLMIIDPELIKHVMTKDFSHFVDRSLLPDLPHDFLVKHLVHMKGDEWRRMRSKLSPTFTSGKMKLYFNLIETVIKHLVDHIEPMAETNSTIEIKELMARFTTDVIATCAFGLDVNSIEDPENRIRQIGRLMITPSRRNFLVSVVYPKVPWLCKILPLTYTNPEVSQFILKLLTDTVEYRKTNSIVRGDFIDLLMKVKNRTLAENKEVNGYKETNEEEMTLKEMAAQMSVFFAAGFETASSTTSFLLYELAVNRHIQDKLRAEIDTVIEENDGQLSYKCLQEMRYLDKCISETLRRYASLPFLQRNCVKAYNVPGSHLVIEEGVKVIIPTYALHHDPLYYPEPYKFDPERFSEEIINSRHQYTYLPFGEGPRICIGKRFGFMQVQLAAITLLRKFDLKLAPGLPTELPISPSHFLTTSAIPIELVISKRKL